MTTDDVLAAIKAADMAYVAWQAVRNERCRRPETDPYGDEDAAMKTKYERAKERAAKAMEEWSETPWRIQRPKDVERSMGLKEVATR